MKTKLFIVLLLALPIIITGVGYAQSMNKLYIPTVESGSGKEISIPVYLTNDAGIVAAQFKIHFPENSIVNQSSVVLSDRKQDHTVSVKNLGNNDYLFVIFSAKNAELRGNSGILLRIPVKVPETWAENSVHPLAFNQVILSTLNGNNVVTTSDPGSIKIIAEPRPDVMVQNITVNQASVSPLGKLNISWQVKNAGDKITGGGWSEQITLITDNGEQVLLGTSYYDQLLEAGAAVSRQVELILPQYPGIDGNAKVQVKVIPNSTLGELITAQSNNTALSDEPLTIDKRLNLTISAKSIQENNLSLIQCRLYRSGSRAVEQTFSLQTDSPERIKLPELVTIKAGQSGVVFYINSIDNKVLNVDTTVVIYAKGIGYNEVSDSLTIFDDEFPSLKITTSKSVLNEGDAFTLTIEREIVTNSALKINLTTDYSKRFSISQEVVIPANEKSVTVNGLVINDVLPALTVYPVITASAFGFTKATCSETLNDNDIPAISMTIAPGTVSESAGYQAAVGAVHRQGSTDNVITIKLTDNSNGTLYYSSSTITLEKGVSEKQFTVGVVDNAIVNGNRDVAITAAVYISTCSCSASGTGAGVVQSKLTILDDDGPALKITSSQTMLPEGKTQATLLTISRNTSTAQALTVNLSSDHADKLTYETTVTIPAGSITVTIPVAVKNNDVSEGDQTVTFTASAEGFTKGVCWAMITDQTLADATANILSISPNNPLAKGTLQAELLVTNSGVAALATHTAVAIYLRKEPGLTSIGTKQLLTTLYTTKEIAPQQNESLVTSITLPDLTGKYYIVAEVNAAQTQKELSYLNNVSEASSIVLLPGYKADVSTDKKVYKPGEIVLFSGKAVAQGSSAVSGVSVDVYIINNGCRQTLKATTDATGAFQVNFTPFSGQIGHFIAGACYPNEALTNEQTSFDIYGLKRTSSDYIKWEVLTNEPTTGEIELINPGNLPLTGLKSTVQSTANGWQLTFDPIPTMDAGGTVKLKYTITGTAASTSTDWEQIKFQVTSKEGAILDLTAYYYCRSPKASLKASLSSIQTSMTKGATRTYQFTLTNKGKGASGKISVLIPSLPWLSLVTPAEMSSLAYGESANVVLQLSPDNDIPANTISKGTIGINCENGSGIPMSFNIETVSEQTGTLTVDVRDEYTYYTSEAPHVSGASVILRNPNTNVIVAQRISNAQGLVTIDNLPEGYYKIQVTADKHDTNTNNILIDPGKTTSTTVNLSFQAITYTWNVVETTVKDVYTTETVVKYETNVPVPVVQVKYPDSLSYKNQIFNIYVTNKGLINAKNVTVNIPAVEGVKFEVLTENPIPELAPQLSMAIAVKMIVDDESATYYSGVKAQISSRVVRSGTNSGTALGKSQTCFTINIYTDYFWQCGDELKSARSSKPYKYGDCLEDTNVYYPTTSGIGSPSGESYSNYNSSGNIVTPTITIEDCNCEIRMLKNIGLSYLSIAGCLFPETAPILCAPGVNDACFLNPPKSNWDKINCGLNIYSCVPLVGSCSAGLISSIASFLIPCESSSPSNSNKLRNKSSKINDDYDRFYEVANSTYNYINALDSILTEILGKKNLENITSDEADILHQYILSHINEAGIIVPKSDIYENKPSNMSKEDLDLFISRLNNTILFDPSNQIDNSNTININKLDEYSNQIKNSNIVAKNLNYNSVLEMYQSELNIIKKKFDGSSKSVCASISLKFSQTMTMTRQAFRGTLSVYNGHETAAMQNVQLNLVIKDGEGNIAGSKLFQVNTESVDKLTAIDGTGSLNAKETGTATILFIPTKYAAPTVSKEYSFGGTLSYLDPFTGTVVTRDLYPVTLTVKPSPDLKLTYFMQRDVLGDDPLTIDVVEPIEPAEFSLLINNQGAGDATNVCFSSSQPQIIKNEKGLLVDFKMIGSSLNGAEKSAVFSNVDFGNILSGKTSYAQWWFTSSLLGHFVEYDTKVTHVTSYDNPDLSLVSDISVHELIRSLSVPNTTGSSLTGFLVNDIPDADDLPDMLYLSDGQNEEVNIVSSAVCTKTSDITYSLVVTPSKTGWNYGIISDPGNGRIKLIGVIRQRDNATISLRNFWQTDRTLRDGKDPLYENRIHFADNIVNASETYLLTFEVKRDDVLAVKAFNGVPEDVSKTPVTKVNVQFSKAIDASTFTIEDISLKCQGKDIDLTKAIISSVSQSEFAIDLSAITGSNGYYVLTVQTNKITDSEGYQGETGKTIGWNQYSDGEVQLLVQVLPVGSGSISPVSGKYTYGNVVSFTAEPTTGYRFKNWTYNGEILSSESTLKYPVTGEQTVVANFEAQNYKVTISYDEKQGAVYGGSTGIYGYGTKFKLTATPATDYAFVGWKVNGVLTETTEFLSITVNEEITVDAEFISTKPKAIPTITWASPDDIVYGMALSGTQLNAMADVPGIFAYTPAIGTVLNISMGQSLQVYFTPSDTLNYESTSKMILINVVQGTLSTSTSSVNIAAIANSTASVDVSSNTTWKASYDPTWLSVSPNTSVMGNKSLTLTASENTGIVRTTTVTLKATTNGVIGVGDQTIIVTQAAASTGYDNEKDNVVSIYPNPVTNTFRLSGLENMAKLTLLDITGKILLAKDDVTANESISVSTLPQGMYILKIVTASSTVEKKLVKK